MPGRILIVDDDEALRESLELLLLADGYRVVSATSGASALELIAQFSIDAVLCDTDISGIDGFDLVPQMARLVADLPIILTSTGSRGDLAVEAMRRGACDYLLKPIPPAEIRFTLRKAHEREGQRRRNDLLERDVARTVGERAIVAASDGMISLLEMLERIAAYKSAVLVTGERGTGKEVIARAIHSQSPRRNAPFLAFHCGSIAENLLESELFGHARGVVTGVTGAKRGLFAEAHEGTLFLDEIADLSSALQVKLLQAITEEEIRPIGDSKAQSIDVRVIAATARDLDAEIAEGRFREDLLDRLGIVRLAVPALRDRRQDIPLLVDHFLSRLREDLGKSIRGVSDEALDRLVEYGWPGNVRELENVIERAIILTDGDSIEVAALAPAIHGSLGAGPRLNESFDEHESLSLKPARQAFEAQHIRRALARTQGNRTHAARLLEISHRALLYKLKDYGIRD